MRNREAEVISHAAAVDKLAEFSQTNTYSIIYTYLLKRREEIIARGKMDKDASLYAKLEGFDRAASVVEDAAMEVKKRAKAREISDEVDE